MPYDPLQLQTDVDFITSQPQWQDEKTRRDYIRQVGVQAKGNIDNEAHTELMNTLWGKMDTRGQLQKAGEFAGRAVGEVVKSIPATFGAVGTALGDIAGVTDTGSGARLKAGVSGLVDTAGQRIKQLDPNDRQEQRDALIESLREDIDKGAVPQGFEKWLAGGYDNKEIDDPETKAFVDAVVSGISRASVAADHMGDIDAYKLRSFMESDRSPFRSDSDLSGEMGARQFLADYVATRDPQSWQQFKDRVTETDAQYRNRLRVYVAQKPRTEEVLASMPEGLEKEMVQRSLSMQESPIDLASALVPAVRGAKALQAAKAGGFGAAAGRFAKGAAIEGAQEAGTEALQDPRATAAQIAEAGALGALGAGALEAGAAGIGVASRRIGGAPAAAPTTPEAPAPVAPTAAESVTVESGEMPLPTVLKTLDEKVKAAVEANADVLPATAAALKETATEPVVEEEVVAEAPAAPAAPVVEETVVAEAPAAPAAPVVEEAVVTETPAQEESPAAPPAEPTDATEGQTPTPGGVGAPPVVTNEPQTPSPAEQPVSAAETPVATEPEAALPETEKVVAPKAEPEQGAEMTQRDTSKPEQMTPEELFEFEKAQAISVAEENLRRAKKGEEAPNVFTNGFKSKAALVRAREAQLEEAKNYSRKPDVFGVVIEAVRNKKPVSSALVDSFSDQDTVFGVGPAGEPGGVSPSPRKQLLERMQGYVRQGDLYVFAPEAPPTQTEAQPKTQPQPKPEDASKNQVEETGGTPPVESQPPQTRPEGEAQEGASQRGREGEEGVLTPEKAAPGVEPGAAALDAEYLAAVEAGDSGNDNLIKLLREAKEVDRKSVVDEWVKSNPKAAVILQRMVDEAAYAAGNDKTVSHQTHTKDIKEFDRNAGNKGLWEWDSIGIWTTGVDTPRLYGPINMLLYGRMINPKRYKDLDAFEQMLREYLGIAYPSIVSRIKTRDTSFDDFQRDFRKEIKNAAKKAGVDGSAYSKKYQEWLKKSFPGADGFRQYLKNQGYDGIQIDGAFWDGEIQTVRVFLEPNQLKSADSVTYDDAGNVIPLSQRFNPDTADIRGGGVTKPQEAAPEFGSTNTIFTKEKAEEASKIIKRKLGQTNVPAFDPELFAAATNYAGFLIEGGVRKFGDFSSRMISEFGETVRPILKSVYSGIRELDIIEGMDDAATVSKVLAGETPVAAPAPAPAAEAPLPQTQQTPVARPSGEPFAAPTEESRAAAPGQIATARSVIDEERKRLGRPPVEGPIMEAISDEAIYAQAKAEYDKDPEVGNRLVDSLNARPRAVDSLQQAILGQELVRRRNALDIASDAYIADPKNTQLEDDFNKASARYEEAKFAAQYGISDVGRTLRLARVLLNLDFSREGLITRFRQASGGVNPNAEQLKKIDELSKTILESEKKVEELRATKEENARLQELLDNMVQDMKDQAIREFNSVEKARKEAKAAFKAAPNKVSALDTLEEKIRARRAERKKKVMADPFLLNALADAIDDVMLGAIKIAKGVRNVAKWMSEMKAENPDYTDEQLQEIRKASENFYENEIKPELGAEAPAAEVVEEETLEDEEGEEDKVFTSFDDVTGRDIYRMVKDRVQKGMTEIGEVMKSVTEEIQKQLPDVTERQVRDRFSGYGRPLFPSQEASAKKVRELRTLAQYASKIEDAQKKIAPLRSGRQRDDATDAIRQAQKELYRLMKENGLEMPPGPRSLKGPLDVIKRRLKNRRDDLQRQMTAGKRDVVSTKKVERDAEAKALEEEIRALDEALDALDPPLPPSYQDKVKDRMRAVDKEIVELRRKIKERDVSKQKPEPIITEQLQVKLNERDALKQALDDLRIEIEGEPQLTQEEINERAERVLDRNIDALEAEIERLKDPNYFPQEAQKAEATPTIIRLRKQQEILREERKKLSEARFGKKVKSESERVDITIAALEKSIDNINQKILTGDLSPTARKGTPLENAKIKNLRAERDSLRSVMSLMRKAKADAAKDPVAEQIRRDRKYLQSRIEYYENIQKKMADGTYKPKVKEQRKYDESLGKELQKLEDAKMAVADMLLQERLKNRSTLRKAFDFIGDLFGIQRVLTATADISAIGNQGNFILFSNPKIALKAIPDMLRAMKNPEGEKAVQERIRNMQEYKDGELNRVGLYLSMDAGPNSPLSKMEEQYATRLVNKWPKAFGGGIVRGSERAYKTFLDVIRVAAYKSMKETLVKGGWFTPPQEATQERLEALSNLVNNATGRGAFKMKKADQLLSQAAPFLNTFIFAPRFGLSRFAMALGLPLWRAAPGTRALIAQEYAKYAIGVSVATMLLSLAQDDEDEPIVPDPRATDFLKTRFGDYRVDLLGGFQQPFVFLTRLLTGETVTAKGNVRALREGDRPLDLLRERPLKLKPNYGSADASSVLGDFLRFKLAPTSASILNALSGKDPVGNRTDVKSEILKAPVPLVVGQLVESLSAEDPADAALLSTLGLTGIRTSYQGKDADKNKTEWEKMVKKVEELTGIK